jgi:hypothetical protein
VDDLVRVAGIRWAIEGCCQAAKNEYGQDQYEVRRRMGGSGTSPSRCSLFPGCDNRAGGRKVLLWFSPCRCCGGCLVESAVAEHGEEDVDTYAPGVDDGAVGSASRSSSQRTWRRRHNAIEVSTQAQAGRPSNGPNRGLLATVHLHYESRSGMPLLFLGRFRSVSLAVPRGSEDLLHDGSEQALPDGPLSSRCRRARGTGRPPYMPQASDHMRSRTRRSNLGQRR